MCPAFLLVTEESKIWHSPSLGTCDRELPAFYSELLVSFDLFFFLINSLKWRNTFLNINQDSLLWFKGSLVIAVPSPPQQVSSVFTLSA